MKKAIILLSGGLDSATVLAKAKADGYNTYTLGFDYGQRHASELKAAIKIAATYSSNPHKIVKLDLRAIGGSSLTSTELDVPDHGDYSENIPNTYVPARNTVFLSIALGYAETLGAFDIFIGANAVDYSGYPDCRPQFITEFERLANVATTAVDTDENYSIHAPLLLLSKAEIVELGTSLNVDYSATVSCYKASLNGEACGNCDSCHLRAEGFKQAGIIDPTRYKK